MSNKNFLLLLSPSLLFIVIAVGSFMLSEVGFRYHDPSQELKSQQKFDRFVENVQSGKWQLTSDKWLEGMRLERKKTESEHRINLTFAKTMRSGGFYILLGIALQAIVIFSLRKEIRKPECPKRSRRRRGCAGPFILAQWPGAPELCVGLHERTRIQYLG